MIILYRSVDIEFSIERVANGSVSLDDIILFLYHRPFLEKINTRHCDVFSLKKITTTSWESIYL